MTELKTKPTGIAVADFLGAIKDAQVRADCWTIAKMMRKATRAKPKMWGPSIVGFGSCRYKYPDGREMDWMLVALSPRKNYISVYAMGEFKGRKRLLGRLGKCNAGKTCINIKRLSDIDLPTLQRIVDASVAGMRAAYPA